MSGLEPWLRSRPQKTTREMGHQRPISTGDTFLAFASHIVQEHRDAAIGIRTAPTSGRGRASNPYIKALNEKLLKPSTVRPTK